MADAMSKSDALGVYLSDPSGLGGSRRDVEFLPLEPIVLTTIGPIIVERFSGACGAGECRIVAAGPDSLQFAAPGEALGAAVTVSANTRALLESESPEKSVRVYRDAVYSAADLGGEMRVRLVPGNNNAVALGNATAAGGTEYGCIWLKNHSAAAVTGITVTGGGAYSVGQETPSGGRVQEIANATTAPSAVSFGGSASVGTLEAGESVAVWLRRVLSSPAASPSTLGSVELVFTAAAVEYTEPLSGYYRVADAAIAGYQLFLGDDALPNFAAAPAAFSATLPFSEALAAGSRWHWCVRAINAFGLTSQNTLCRSVLVGAGGEDETEALTDPVVVSLASAAGGEVDLRLRYNGSADATSADTWRVYVATGGVNPDPDTDTPLDSDMTVTGLARPEVETVVHLGPYLYGTTVRVIARVYSSTLEAESASETLHEITVSTQAPVGVHFGGISAGGRGLGRSLMEGTMAYGDAEVRASAGETVLAGDGEVFRGELGARALFRTGLEFHTVAQGAAGSASPIEAVSGDEIYINVGGVRRAKIDLALGRIEASGFTFNVAISLPVAGAVWAAETATYIMVRNGVTGRWTPAVKVDEAGQFTVCLPVLQEVA